MCLFIFSFYSIPDDFRRSRGGSTAPEGDADDGQSEARVPVRRLGYGGAKPRVFRATSQTSGKSRGMWGGRGPLCLPSRRLVHQQLMFNCSSPLSGSGSPLTILQSCCHCHTRVSVPTGCSAIVVNQQSHYSV